MEKVAQIILGLLAVAAVSAVIYARMQQNPPILWPALFAVCVGIALLGLMWIVATDKNHEK